MLIELKPILQFSYKRKIIVKNETKFVEEDDELLELPVLNLQILYKFLFN